MFNYHNLGATRTWKKTTTVHASEPSNRSLFISRCLELEGQTDVKADVCKSVIERPLWAVLADTGGNLSVAAYDRKDRNAHLTVIGKLGKLGRVIPIPDRGIPVGFEALR